MRPTCSSKSALTPAPMSLTALLMRGPTGHRGQHRICRESKQLKVVKVLVAKAFSCSFLTEKITTSHIPSVYTASATYLGTITQLRTSFMSKRSYVANLQSAREVLAMTAEHSPPYPSTSASWTESDMGSTRMLHSSTMGSGVLLKLLGAKRNKCGSCD